MTSFNDGIEAADTLWCVHIVGPDDIHAAPNFETAWEWADAANKMIAPYADERDVLWRCTVAIWPWDAASHAEDAKRGGRNDDIDFPAIVRALKRPEPGEDMIERLSAWWRSWDTGLSSEAIALFLGMGVKSEHTPSDSADLGRCHRLLDKVPEWRPRLPEMRNAGGAWPFIVDRWDELELHYKTGNWDAVYALLNEAHSEHRAALKAMEG